VPDHLALIACGAPLAARVPEVAAALAEAGWLVRVIATPSALAWLDQAAAEQATGYPVLTGQRRPDQAKRFPPPAHVIVCPATFNTINKLAAGIMDNYPAGLLCEALATRTPITIAPMVSNRLWDHPAWQRNLDILTAADVQFLDIRTGRVGTPQPVQSGTGGDITTAFDPTWPAAAAGRPAQKS